MSSDKELDGVLEKGTKEEILFYLESHYHPATAKQIVDRLRDFDREALVSHIKGQVAPPLAHPVRNCRVCGQPMKFESSCADKRKFGIDGKYFCMTCMTFELFVTPKEGD